MYTSIRSAIKYYKEITYNIISHLGIKQGVPSSNFFFTIFVNDTLDNINTNIEKIKIFLIANADDQDLFSTSSNSLQSMFSLCSMT